jgi:hypothetical protein
MLVFHDEQAVRSGTSSRTGPACSSPASMEVHAQIMPNLNCRIPTRLPPTGGRERFRDRTGLPSLSKFSRWNVRSLDKAGRACGGGAARPIFHSRRRLPPHHLLRCSFDMRASFLHGSCNKFSGGRAAWRPAPSWACATATSCSPRSSAGRTCSRRPP